MNTGVVKSQFTRCIQSLQNVFDFQTGVLDLVHKHDPYADFGIFNYPSCEDELLRLLETIMEDDEGLISEYCYNFNFGRDWEEGDLDISLATVDDLWEALTNK